MSTDVGHFPFRKRLAYKQARAIVLLAFFLGLFFSVTQIYVDYREQKIELLTSVVQVIKTMTQPAAEAAFHLDSELAKQVGRGLFEYSPIIAVRIVGYLEGNVYSNDLVSIKRGVKERQYQWALKLLFGESQTHKVKLILADDPKKETIGLLEVVIDPYEMGRSFIERAFITLGFGIIRTTVFACIILLYFYLTLTKPLQTLSLAWLKINPEHPGNKPVDILEKHDQDELGTLVNGANKVISAINKHLVQLRRAEEALRTANEQLEARVAKRTEQLNEAKVQAESATQAKSEFLATMSHEIRTPLNGVMGMLQVLELTPMSEEQKSTVSIIHHSSSMLLAIINNILDFSKIEADQIELESIPFSIIEVINSVTTATNLSCIEKGLTVTNDLDARLPQAVLGDPIRVRQVLLNLVSNAIKFTDEGTVSVTATATEYTDVTASVLFEITDTGIGLSRKQREKLFQPFSQADSSTTRRFGGTGLGLSICQRLITLMDGEFGVDSTLHKGSRFWFLIVFPIVTPEAVVLGRTDTRLPLPMSILVVEDNEINRKVVLALLSKVGHSVDTANNGKQALLALENRQYDVILMDVHMPEMDGLEATRAIRAMTGGQSETPIVILSADIQPQTKQRFLKANVNAFITKPFEMDLINQVLCKIQDHKKFLKNVNQTFNGVQSAQSEPLFNATGLLVMENSIGNTLLLELLSDFINLKHKVLKEIENDMEIGDLEQLKEALHSFGGAANQLNLTMLAKLAKQFEERIGNQATEPTRIKLEKCCQETIAELYKLYPDLNCVHPLKR